MRYYGFANAYSSSGAVKVWRGYGYATAPVVVPARSKAFKAVARGTRAAAFGRFRAVDDIPPGSIKPRYFHQPHARGTRTIAYGAQHNAYIGPVTAGLSLNDGNDAGTLASVLLGVLGSEVPAFGDDGPALLYDEVVAYSLQANYVRAEILSVTAGYTLIFYGDSSFSVVAPAPVGVCYITYQWYVDGVLQSGTGTATIDFPAFAVLNTPDADDQFTGASTSVYVGRNVALSVTDAADSLSALATSPSALRNASLSASDAADTATGAAVVQLPERTAGTAVVDQADQFLGILLHSDERLVSMNVTDANDILLSMAYWLDPAIAGLTLSDGNDAVSAVMNTAPGTREKVTHKSAIVMQVTLQSPIDLG